MAGFGPLPTDWASRYEFNMRHAADQYEDAIGALNSVLSGAFMTQLGGMCLAIQVPIEGGWIWVSDEEDNLPWDRGHHRGWHIGLYLGDPMTDEGSQPARDLSTSDSSLGGLLTTLQVVLHGVWPNP